MSEKTVVILIHGIRTAAWWQNRVASIIEREPLKGLTNLSLLRLYGATEITSLEPLKGLSNLSETQCQRRDWHYQRGAAQGAHEPPHLRDHRRYQLGAAAERRFS
jgi:hypothetical protein